jgi:hypothetical protein
MKPVTELRRPIKYAVSPGPDSARKTAISTAEGLIGALLQCVLWLLKHGVYVVGFQGYQQGGVDRVVVTVAPSPLLHRLLPDCAWRARRQEGALTIYTWFAVRFDVRIEWEEVTCA